MRHWSVKDESNASWSICMYTYLRNIFPLSSLIFYLESLSLYSKLWWLFRACLLKSHLVDLFFIEFFFSLIVSFDGFGSCLLKPYLVILTFEKDTTSTYFFAHNLSEWLLALYYISCFLRKGIMEPTLCVLVDCPPIWSCLQVFNLGFH